MNTLKTSNEPEYFLSLMLRNLHIKPHTKIDKVNLFNWFMAALTHI